MSQRSKRVERWLASPNHPVIPPVELAGQWIAWNRSRTEIIAHGPNLAEVDKHAQAIVNDGFILQKLPPVDAVLIGVI